MKRVTASGILLILLLSSCRRNVTQQSVVGIYTSRRPEFGTLQVQPDGHYSHRFQNASGAWRTNQNTWEFEHVEGDPYISFTGFEWPETFSTTPKGYWGVEVEQRFRTLRLCIDADRGIYFLKKKWPASRKLDIPAEADSDARQ